ncbi:type II/IV secretion system protein [Candidatus Gracilibacteria bacterium]|nr:type II/IV secretion system protein [Candidatus Gracilibacteria bacterium]
MSKIQKIIKDFKSKIEKDNKNLKSKDSNSQVDDLFLVSQTTSSVGLKGSNLSINKNLKEDDENIIYFVNDLILNAISKGVSDIHIEPNDKEVKIRFRIDGNFINYKSFELSKASSLIARIKILAYLRIDEQRLPQDGKINFNFFGGKSVDLRISILPNIYGEKIVIRILKKEEKPTDLKNLGILPYNMVKIKKHLGDTHGMILAVGPTGSGKSTTLFSLLSQFNALDNNISTLEDPVEYRIPGVNHTQINPSIGFTFASGLRSLLRQDPDIIMVGEIRDEETAKLAVESSITGHLVFSTLHTNSATHTLSRLVNLGVDPLLLSSSLRLIISQRLVRKLCSKCREKYSPEDRVKNAIIGKVGKYIKDKENILLYKAKDGGCEQCNNTGYKGRIGIYEILEMNDKIEDLLIKNASKTQIEIQAIGDGMVTIKEDAFLKVVMGDTSIEEILSVLGN